MLDSGVVVGQLFSTASVAVLLLFVHPALVRSQRQSIDLPGEIFESTVNRYCVGCHNDRTRTAGLTLGGVSASEVAASRTRATNDTINVATTIPSARTREPPRIAADSTGTRIACFSMGVDTSEIKGSHPF